MGTLYRGTGQGLPRKFHGILSRASRERSRETSRGDRSGSIGMARFGARIIDRSATISPLFPHSLIVVRNLNSCARTIGCDSGIHPNDRAFLLTRGKGGGGTCAMAFRRWHGGGGFTVRVYATRARARASISPRPRELSVTQRR